MHFRKLVLHNDLQRNEEQEDLLSWQLLETSKKRHQFFQFWGLVYALIAALLLLVMLTTRQ
jgi:hypothetical protein